MSDWTRVWEPTWDLELRFGPSYVRTADRRAVADPNMLREGSRIQMSEEEHQAVEFLLEENGPVATLTRSDPGESGSLLVEIDGTVWAVNEDGTTEKQ